MIQGRSAEYNNAEGKYSRLLVELKILRGHLIEPFGLVYNEHNRGSPFGEERLFHMITDAKSFGAALRQRRKELGYTQSFLSEFSGFSISFISDLENGKATAELGKSLYLANLLGLDCNLTRRGD